MPKNGTATSSAHLSTPINLGNTENQYEAGNMRCPGGCTHASCLAAYDGVVSRQRGHVSTGSQQVRQISQRKHKRGEYIPCHKNKRRRPLETSAIRNFDGHIICVYYLRVILRETPEGCYRLPTMRRRRRVHELRSKICAHTPPHVQGHSRVVNSCGCTVRPEAESGKELGTLADRIVHDHGHNESRSPNQNHIATVRKWRNPNGLGNVAITC